MGRKIIVSREAFFDLKATEREPEGVGSGRRTKAGLGGRMKVEGVISGCFLGIFLMQPWELVGFVRSPHPPEALIFRLDESVPKCKFIADIVIAGFVH